MKMFNDIEKSILNLMTVHDENNIISVPFDKLKDLKLVLRLQDSECQTTNLPEAIELQELDYFKHSKDKIFIMYKVNDNKISSSTISSFYFDTRELTVSDTDIERKIKPSQLVQSFTANYIKSSDIKGRIVQQEFIFNKLLDDYYISTDVEDTKNDN